jgi:hypothetical protein
MIDRILSVPIGVIHPHADHLLPSPNLAVTKRDEVIPCLDVLALRRGGVIQCQDVLAEVMGSMYLHLWIFQDRFKRDNKFLLEVQDGLLPVVRLLEGQCWVG